VLGGSSGEVKRARLRTRQSPLRGPTLDNANDAARVFSRGWDDRNARMWPSHHALGGRKSLSHVSFRNEKGLRVPPKRKSQIFAYERWRLIREHFCDINSHTCLIRSWRPTKNKNIRDQSPFPKRRRAGRRIRQAEERENRSRLSDLPRHYSDIRDEPDAEEGLP